MDIDLTARFQLGHRWIAVSTCISRVEFAKLGERYVRE
jgi:hypothetical protein